jgi:hypothetical protein
MGFKDWIVGKLQRKVYSYELQECGKAKGGWTTIATTDKFQKAVAFAEYFKPGFMYRLMARDLEKGTFSQVKWKHFEPSLEIEKTEKEKEERSPPSRMPTPAEIMTLWAENLEKQMEPVFTFGRVMKSLRESFNEAFGGTTSESGEGGIPPPQFEGKLPAMMHPYVMREVGETVKGVTDHFFGKLDEFRKKALMPPQGVETPSVEFPAIEEYAPEASKEVAEERPPSEEKPSEEKPVVAEAEKPEEPQEAEAKQVELKPKEKKGRRRKESE